MKRTSQPSGWAERWGLAADIREPRRTLVAVAALAITVVLHPAVHDLWYQYVPAWLAIIPGTLQTVGPIPSLALLGLIGPRLWRAGGRSRAVGIGALVAAFIVSAWGFSIFLDQFALRPH